MNAERLVFSWRDGQVSGARVRPAGDARATLVLGHGAGGNLDAPTLVGVGDGLAARGIETVRFNFPYREAGRKAPDKQDRLEACYWAVAKEVAGNAARIYLGGSSMGGRIASHIVADGFPAVGLVFLSYPLHPPGKPERLRVAHLGRVGAPMLFLSGTRDSFATPELLEQTVKTLPGATLHWLEGADHGLKVKGRPAADVLAEIESTVVEWMGL